MTEPLRDYAPSTWNYWPSKADLDNEQTRALIRLAAALRRVNELLVDADPSPGEIEAQAEVIERVAETIAGMPRGRSDRFHRAVPDANAPGTARPGSPVSGLANAIAPPVVYDDEPIDEQTVGATAVFNAAYEGPPGHVHGGWVAAVADEVLGRTQALSGQMGMTGTLTVRYRSPTPLDKEIRFIARLDRVEGRKVFATCEVTCDGRLCAEAEAIFVRVDFDVMRERVIEAERARRAAEGR